MRRRFALQGFIPDPGTPEALTDQIRRDIEKWKEVIPRAGIKPSDIGHFGPKPL